MKRRTETDLNHVDHIHNQRFELELQHRIFGITTGDFVRGIRMKPGGELFLMRVRKTQEQSIHKL
jgi:hypothetical protein